MNSPDPTISARVEALLVDLYRYRRHSAEGLDVVFFDDVRRTVTRLVADLVTAEQERDKWLDNFNRSEQFQNGPTKRAEAAEQALADSQAYAQSLYDAGIVLQSHLSLLLSDTCTSEDRTRIRRAMGWIPEGKADRPEHRQEYCADCDGCGWVEGGSTLKTECATCKGTGVVLRDLAPHGVIVRRETT